MLSQSLTARWIRRGVLAVTVATVAVASPAAPLRVEAAGIVVNTLAGTYTSDGLCSLPEAMVNADKDVAFFPDCPAGIGADLITFSVSGTITLSGTLQEVTDPLGVIVDGTGQTVTISGNNLVRAFDVRSTGVLQLHNLTIVNGRTASNGGAIITGGALSLASSTVANSYAFGPGGGIYAEAGTLTVRNSTLSGNVGSSGGGIHSQVAATTITNSTISGNAGQYGGGLYNNAGSLTVFNSTITSNTSTGTFISNTGGGVFAELGGSTALVNSILAGNTASSGGDCRGQLSTPGPNLIGDIAGCTVTGTAPLLGAPQIAPLADNGGQTKTHALLPGSPAIDTGNDPVCAAAPVSGLDQRAVARPQGIHCDLGAFELLSLPALLINDVESPEGHSGVTPFTFLVGLAGVSGVPVTVHVATASSTAGSPSDYLAMSDTLITFAPGETTKPVTVSVNGDTALEPNETFFVNLSNPTGAVIADGQGIGTIINDDIAGGRNLRISTGSIDLSWDGGTAQTGYYLLRYNTDTTAADLIPLAGNLTSYSDVSAINGTVYCYVLAAMNGGSVLGLSDLLCGLTGISSGNAVPGGFALALNQTANATLTWTPPAGGVGSYLLQRIPLDGTPISNVPLGAGVTTTTQAVTSAGTCFQLIAFRGLEFGTTNVLCGVPGIATLGAGGRVASIDEVAERVAEVAGAVQAAGVLRP